nr:beta-mannosidase [Bifidobacterium animalis]
MFRFQSSCGVGAAVCGARKANGSDHKLVIQMNANGVTFEAYPSLKGKDAQVRQAGRVERG